MIINDQSSEILFLEDSMHCYVFGRVVETGKKIGELVGKLSLECEFVRDCTHEKVSVAVCFRCL